MIFSTAAGLTMILATAIAIYSQYKFGIFTMAFFITRVMSYVFKDRIKEIARDCLSSKLLRFSYEQKVRICRLFRDHPLYSTSGSCSHKNINTIKKRRPGGKGSPLGDSKASA